MFMSLSLLLSTIIGADFGTLVEDFRLGFGRLLEDAVGAGSGSMGRRFCVGGGMFMSLSLWLSTIIGADFGTLVEDFRLGFGRLLEDAVGAGSGSMGRRFCVGGGMFMSLSLWLSTIIGADFGTLVEDFRLGFGRLLEDAVGAGSGSMDRRFCVGGNALVEDFRLGSARRLEETIGADCGSMDKCF
jgi:hypothetical protein